MNMNLKTNWILGVCVLASACSSDPAPNDASTATDVVSADVVSADVVSADVVSADVVSADAATGDAATGDAATGDAGAPDPWACLGMVPARMAMGTMSTTRVRVLNFSNRTPMAGLTVKACIRADIACVTPHSMGTTDAMGYVTLTFPLPPNGFDGYFECTGGTGSGAVTPTRTFFSPPVTTTMGDVNSLVVPAATFMALGGALGAMLDDTHGAITFGVGTCLGTPGSGATVSIAPAAMGSTAFYNVTGLPDPRATQTDSSGQGGFLNVPPGDYTLTGNRVSPAARIGNVAINVRGRFVTAVTVLPSP